jgi:hypothetical protein
MCGGAPLICVPKITGGELGDFSVDSQSKIIIPLSK